MTRTTTRNVRILRASAIGVSSSWDARAFSDKASLRLGIVACSQTNQRPWRNISTFELNGVTATWLCTRPPAWGGPWGFGCWVCNQCLSIPRCKMQAIECQFISKQVIVEHGKCTARQAALERLREASDLSSGQALCNEADTVSVV